MKKIAMLLIAALLLCALATAETAQTSAYALTLPEGFVPVTEAELEGYREASARDAGGVYQGEALMARRGNAAISVVETATAYAGTREAAEALVPNTPTTWPALTASSRSISRPAGASSP